MTPSETSRRPPSSRVAPGHVWVPRNIIKCRTALFRFYERFATDKSRARRSGGIRGWLEPANVCFLSFVLIKITMLGTVITWALLAGRGLSQNTTGNAESSITSLSIDRERIGTTTFATITQLPPTRTTTGPRTTYGPEFVTLTSTTTSDDTYTPSSTETRGEDEDPTSEPTAVPTVEPTQDWDTEPPPPSSTEEWVPPPSITHSPNPDDNYVPTTFVANSAPKSTSTSATSTLPSHTAATSLTAARTSGDESVFLSTRTLIPVGTDSPTAAAVGVAGHSKSNVGGIAGGTVSLPAVIGDERDILTIPGWRCSGACSDRTGHLVLPETSKPGKVGPRLAERS